MINIVSRNVDDLPQSSREGIEQLLGVELKPHQRVHIVVDDPPLGPAGPKRVEAALRIREIIAQAQLMAERNDVSDGESDSAVKDGATQTRPRA